MLTFSTEVAVGPSVFSSLFVKRKYELTTLKRYTPANVRMITKRMSMPRFIQIFFFFSLFFSPQELV